MGEGLQRAQNKARETRGGKTHFRRPPLPGVIAKVACGKRSAWHTERVSDVTCATCNRVLAFWHNVKERV